MEIGHTAIWASDLTATREFYLDAIGLEVQHEFTGTDGVDNYFLGTGSGAELQIKHDSSTEREISPSGIDHISLSVEDTDAIFDRVVELTGARVVEEPMDHPVVGRRVAFIQDPDGYVVELVEAE